jgi:hypothetical protein
MSLSLLGLRYSMSQYRAVQYTDTEQHRIKQSSVVQCSVVQCSAVQYSAVQCSAISHRLQLATVQQQWCVTDDSPPTSHISFIVCHLSGLTPAPTGFSKTVIECFSTRSKGIFSTPFTFRHFDTTVQYSTARTP